MSSVPMANRRTLLLATAGFAASTPLLKPGFAQAQSMAQPQWVPPSPGWTRAMPAAPDVRVKITEAYAAHVARDAYFWAWPMVNIYNRRVAFSQVKEAMKTGSLIQAPVNRLAMLTDYIGPEERSVACPNQDVVYGIGSLALDVSPVLDGERKALVMPFGTSPFQFGPFVGDLSAEDRSVPFMSSRHRLYSQLPSDSRRSALNVSGGTARFRQLPRAFQKHIFVAFSG